MKSGEVLYGWVGPFRSSQIDRLDILVTFLTEVDAIGFLLLRIKIVEGLLFFIIAERAEEPFYPPLISTKGTEEGPLSNFFTQESQIRERTTNRTGPS